jgi:hypothetical protein
VLAVKFSEPGYEIVVFVDHRALVNASNISLLSILLASTPLKKPNDAAVEATTKLENRMVRVEIFVCLKYSEKLARLAQLDRLLVTKGEEIVEIWHGLSFISTSWFCGGIPSYSTNGLARAKSISLATIFSLCKIVHLDRHIRF